MILARIGLYKVLICIVPLETKPAKGAGRLCLTGDTVSISQGLFCRRDVHSSPYKSKFFSITRGLFCIPAGEKYSPRRIEPSVLITGGLLCISALFALLRRSSFGFVAVSLLRQPPSLLNQSVYTICSLPWVASVIKIRQRDALSSGHQGIGG